MFDAGKTRIIGLPYGGKNYDDVLSRFHLIPERYGQTDRQIDGRTVGLCESSLPLLYYFKVITTLYLLLANKKYLQPSSNVGLRSLGDVERN